jgi:hypothetical protein
MSLKLNTASGGSITLQEADTASNLTLTVPAQAGSIVAADSSGNVGIGTSSPNQKLDVRNSGTTSIKAQSSGGSAQVILNSVSGGISYINYGQTGANTLAFYDSNAGVERMRIDTSGRVTTPSQPAFAVWNSSGVSATAVIVFTTTRVNVGSVYNTANGRFTAPISGNYWISYYGLANSGNCNIGMNVNGSRIYYSESDESNYHQIGVSGMLALSAGDYVEIQCYTGSLYQNYNNFSGWLVS